MEKKILTTSDSDLFRQSVGKVQAVKSDKIVLVKEPKTKPSQRPKALHQGTHLIDFADSGIEPIGIEDSLSYFAPGLQPKVLARLRTGYFGLDAEIDLHGLNSSEAKQQLLKFLQIGVEKCYRSVHIIHGKGFRSSNNLPILKNNLNCWLRHHNDVLAFCSALPKQGGTGALWVLLKLSEKHRPERNVD